MFISTIIIYYASQTPYSSPSSQIFNTIKEVEGGAEGAVCV